MEIAKKRVSKKRLFIAELIEQEDLTKLFLLLNYFEFNSLNA